MFKNFTEKDVTVTPSGKAFDDLEPGENFLVPKREDAEHPGIVTKTVSDEALTSQLIVLKMVYDENQTAAGCPELPDGQHGPGMQVKP